MKISTASAVCQTGVVDYFVSSGIWAAGATQERRPPLDDNVYEAWNRHGSYQGYRSRQTEHIHQVKASHVVSHSNAAVFPGSLATRVVLDHAKTYRRLINLIDRFQASGSPLVSSSNVRISKDSADAARAFLDAIEPFGSPPQIGTDDDSVVFAWERPDATTLVIIDGWRLHLVERAGTATSSYAEDLSFDDNKLPDRISSAVPAR